MRQFRGLRQAKRRRAVVESKWEQKQRRKRERALIASARRAQDEEVGDGTTSVIILSGEILGAAEPLLNRNFHPTVIVKGYMMALQKALDVCKDIARTIDIDNHDELKELVTSTIGTKFSSRWGDMLVNMLIDSLIMIDLIDIIVVTEIMIDMILE